MQRKKHAVLHIALLFVIQWLSVTVIILNALALNSIKDSNQNLIIATKTGPQEFILLIIGAVSLFAASLLLCVYLHIMFRLLGKHPIATSKKVLVTEFVLSIIIITLWTTASIIILVHFNKSSSCQQRQITSNLTFDPEDSNGISSKACNLAHAMIAVGFISIGIWVLVFVMSTYSLSELIDYKNISGKFTMQQTRSTIYPYENTKLETNCLGSYSSTAMLNMHPSAAATTTVTAEKAELIIIGSPLIGANKADKEEGGLVKISLNDINLEQERRVVIDDLQPYPQEPATATVKASSRNLVDYEFMKFEPINLDLMLPSTSELLKAARRKIKEKNHYYHYS